MNRVFINLTLTIWIILAAIFIKEISTYRTSKKENQFDEYYVEHEISTIEAKNSALSIDLKSLIAPPGCQECTKEEISYCLSTNLINDHCCCDKRHEEVFPYVPHTCYLGAQLCNTVIEDCAQYNRLRECCCDKYTKKHWKNLLKSSINRLNPCSFLYLLCTIVLFHTLLYCK